MNPILNEMFRDFFFSANQPYKTYIVALLIISRSVIFNSLQVFLDFRPVHTIDAMKLDKHYIDEKDLWKVKIELEDSQIGGEKVRILLHSRDLLYSCH